MMLRRLALSLVIVSCLPAAAPPKKQPPAPPKPKGAAAWLASKLGIDAKAFANMTSVRGDAAAGAGSRVVELDLATKAEKTLWACGRCWSPALAPNGIAVLREDAGATSLWLVPSDGSAPRSIVALSSPAAILGASDSAGALAVAVRDQRCGASEYAVAIVDVARGTARVDANAPCLVPPFPARDRLLRNRLIATTAERDATGKRVPRRLIVKEPADAEAPSAKRLAAFTDAVDRFDPIWRDAAHVVYVASGGETPAATPPSTMTSFFLHAWVPELGAPAAASELESGLVRVAALVRDGRFKTAEAELARLEPLAASAREKFLHRVFATQAHVRRYFTIDSDELQVDQQLPFSIPAHHLEVVAVLDALLPQLDEADARSTFGLLLSVDNDLQSQPQSWRVQAEMRGLALYAAIPSNTEGWLKLRELSRESYGRLAERALITADDAKLMNLLIDGRIAAARRDTATAVRLLEEALAMATPDAKPHLMLQLGDAHAAPLGSPLLLGLNARTGTWTNSALAYAVLTPATAPPTAEGIASAARWYDRAAEAANGDTAILQRVASRRAFVRYLRGDRTGAAADYERIGKGEGVTAWAASVASGVLQNRRADIRRGIAGAAAEDFEGAVASFGETALTFAFMSIHLAGDRARGIEVLEHATDAVIETGRGLLAFGLLKELAGLYNDAGRQNAAIVAARQALALAEERLPLIERAFADELVPELAVIDARKEIPSLRQRREIYASAKRTDEMTGGWTREVAELGRQTNADLQQLAPVYEYVKKVTGIDAVLLAEIKAETDEVRRIPDCAGRMDKLREVRRRSIESGMRDWALIFDLENADCAREWLLEDRARIEAEDVVAPLAEAAKGDTPVDVLAPKLRVVLRSLEVLENADGWEALARHAAKFAELTATVPALKRAAAQAQRYVALAALERGNAAEARAIVAAASSSPQWSSYTAEDRMALLAVGVDAEAALCGSGSCDAARALHVLELLHHAQREAQFLRSGVAAQRKGTAELAALEARLATAETITAADLQRLRRLRDEQTAESASAASPPTAAQVDAVLRALPDGVTALVFHPARRHMLAWKARKGELRLVRVANPESKIETLAAALQSELASVVDEGWPDIAASLRAELLDPLGAIPAGDRIVVVAGGAIGAIPFELIAGREHAITVTDAIVGTASPVSGRKAVVVGLNSGPLTLAEDEARVVAQLVGATALTGAEATAAKVRQQLRDARNVHFATHATLVSENPFETWLTLAGGERLEAWRLFRDAPAARLITLSACEAAARPRALAGKAAAVSESTSLVAFAFAGNARYVLASLWRANDRFAFELMKAFYGNLKAIPGDEAAALHRAKAAIAKDGAVHPFYWANFVLFARSLEAVQ